MTIKEDEANSDKTYLISTSGPEDKRKSKYVNGMHTQFKREASPPKLQCVNFSGTTEKNECHF